MFEPNLDLLGRLPSLGRERGHESPLHFTWIVGNRQKTSGSNDVCSARSAGLLPNRHPGAVLAIAGSETSALGRRIPSHRARCVIPTLLAAPTASLDLGPPNGAGTRQIWER